MEDHVLSKDQKPTLNCLFLSANPTNCENFQKPRSHSYFILKFYETWHKDFFYFEFKKKLKKSQNKSHHPS